YLDVDALCHADLPRWVALDSRLPLRGGRGRSRVPLAAILVDHAAHGDAFLDARDPFSRDRKLQDVRHGQSAHLGRSGVDHGGCLDHPEARGVREMAHRLFVGAGNHSLRHRLWFCQYLCESPQPGEAAMSMPLSAHSVAEPSRWSKRLASLIVAAYAIVPIRPLLWISLTGFKTPPDSIAYPPKILFEPSVEGYVNLFTTRSRQTPEFLESLPPPQTWYERLGGSRNMVIGGPSKVVPRFANSMIIAFGSTFLAVCFGTIAA